MAQPSLCSITENPPLFYIWLKDAALLLLKDAALLLLKDAALLLLKDAALLLLKDAALLLPEDASLLWLSSPCGAHMATCVVHSIVHLPLQPLACFPLHSVNAFPV